MVFSYRSSLLFSSFTCVGFWAVFLPGFFSADSVAVLEMVRSGDLNSSHTAPYAILVKVFSFSGRLPEIVTLINLLLLVFATITFIWSLDYSAKAKFISSLLFSFSPLLWGMGITLWHDIPFTAGLLILLISCHRKRRNLPYVQLALISGILISFRPNGLPTLAIFLTLAVIAKWRKSRNFLLPLLMSLCAAGVSFFGSALLIKQPAVQAHYAQEWLRNDLSCYAAKEAEKFSRNFADILGTSQEWQSLRACTFLNDAEFRLNESLLKNSYGNASFAWLELLRTDALFLFKTHLERHSYLVPLPLYGIPSPPFLHTNIEIESDDLKWVNPKVAKKVRIFPRAMNLFRSFFAFSGLWLLITFCVALKRRGELEIDAFLLSASITLTLFVFAPIPDGRYALLILLVGQSMFLLNLVELCKTMILKRRKPKAQTPKS